MMKESGILTKEKDGFKGYFYKSTGNKEAVITLSGDDGNDFLSSAFTKYFLAKDISVLALALRQNDKADSGVSQWEIENVRNAAEFLKKSGFEKIAVCGISMQAVIALASASLIEDISLVIAFTPCDYIPWGFYHGRIGKDKNAEWPSGHSLLTYEGKELDFQPSPLEKEEYWQKFLDDKKQFKENHSREIFELSEKIHPVGESSFIKVENIRGSIVLIGSGDDSMWNSVKYISRMERRLKEKSPETPLFLLTYIFGTHLLLPQSLVKGALSVLGGLVYKMFASGREHPKECRASRYDLDEKMDKILNYWKKQ